MKKITLIVVLSLLACSAAQGQLLYKISGKNLKTPSYIVGTYHLAPASYADSISGLKEALASCEQVYGELDMLDLLQSPEKMTKMQRAQMLPEGTTLSSLLTKEQMERLNALMREVMGVDMNNEAVAAQMDGFTPAAIVTTLTMMAYLKETPTFNPMQLLDAHIQQEAQRQGKAIGGFETVEFQISVLYSKPLKEQVADLMCTVDHFQDVSDLGDFVTTAYFAQDLGQLAELLEDESEVACAASAEDNDNLIYNRNADWVKKMPAIMAEKATFFAVGAAHLAGERGVLRELEKMGFKVDGVR